MVVVAAGIFHSISRFHQRAVLDSGFLRPAGPHEVFALSLTGLGCFAAQPGFPPPLVVSLRRGSGRLCPALLAISAVVAAGTTFSLDYRRLELWSGLPPFLGLRRLAASQDRAFSALLAYESQPLAFVAAFGGSHRYTHRVKIGHANINIFPVAFV